MGYRTRITVRGKDGKSVTDFGDQNDGHGTGVASLIVGKHYGVAKRVTVVSVKMSADAGLVVEDELDAWRWAIEDVRARDREGKAVFVLTTGQLCACNTFDCLVTFPHPASDYPEVRRNTRHAEYAYRAPYNIPRPAKADPWVDLLAEAWQTGIVTVFSAGNRPGGAELIGGANPQRFATSNNPMIIVGSIDNRGSKSRFNREVGAPPESPGLSIDSAVGTAKSSLSISRMPFDKLRDGMLLVHTTTISQQKRGQNIATGCHKDTWPYNSPANPNHHSHYSLITTVKKLE